MIGVALHLAALVPAAVAARVTRAALGLLCRAPQGSEIEQLAAECDVLREERDTARIEHAAAGEVCDELKKLLATARAERDELRGLARAVVSAMQDSDGAAPTYCDECELRLATRTRSHKNWEQAICDECEVPGPMSDLSYARPWRALCDALVAAEEAPRG